MPDESSKDKTDDKAQAGTTVMHKGTPIFRRRPVRDGQTAASGDVSSSASAPDTQSENTAPNGTETPIETETPKENETQEQVETKEPEPIDTKPPEPEQTEPEPEPIEAEAPESEPELEPVGARRHEPKAARKMSAADFKVKKEEPKPEPPVEQAPKEEPTPQPKAEPRPEPVQTQSATAKPPQDIPPQAPKAEPVRQEPPGAAPESVSEPVRGPEPPPIYGNSSGYSAREPPAEPVRQPMYNEPDTTSRTNGNQNGNGGPKKFGMPHSSGGIMDAIKGMLSFFTIIPIKVDERNIDAVNRNFYFAPFIGFIIGIIAAVIGLIFYELNMGGFATAALVLAAVLLISKFLHFDGLADFGDGLVASGDREKHVKALKDTRIGAGGLGVAMIITLISLACLSQIGGISATSGFTIYPLGGFIAVSIVIVSMEIYAKNAMVVAAAFGEPGEGMAAEQVRRTETGSILLSSILSLALAAAAWFVFSLVVGIISPFGMLGGDFFWMGIGVIVVGVLISIAIGWLMANFSNKTFGFVNGDVLGATNEITRAIVLIVAVIIVFKMIV